MSTLRSLICWQRKGARWHLPAEHPQHQVENEEGAEQDKADKIDPGPFVANGIVNLARREAEVCHLGTPQQLLGALSPPKGAPGMAAG